MSNQQKDLKLYCPSVPLRCKPYSRYWIHNVLLPLAVYYKNAENIYSPEYVLNRAKGELLLHIHPFLKSETYRLLNSNFNTADEHALESAIFYAGYKAVTKFNFDTPITWPALLKAKIKVAPIEAARAASTISRARIQHYQTFRTALEAATRKKQGSLSMSERNYIAQKEISATTTYDWPTVVQQSISQTALDTVPEYSEVLVDKTAPLPEQEYVSQEFLTTFYTLLANTPPTTQKLLLTQLERLHSGKPLSKTFRKKIPKSLYDSFYTLLY